MGGAQLMPGFDSGGAALDLHRIAEAAQHALGVVAVGAGSVTEVSLRGVEPGEHRQDFTWALAIGMS